MKKKVLLVLAAIILLAGLTSCRFMLDTDVGEYLSTDISGHFESDQQYTSSDSVTVDGSYYTTRITETFASDGTYTRLTEIYENGTDLDGDGAFYDYLEWSLIEGEYSYNLAFMTLEKSYKTGENYYSYDSNTGVYTYTGTLTSFTYRSNTRRETLYFTDTRYGNAYMSGLGKYTYTYRYTGEDGDYYRYESSKSFIGDRMIFEYREWDDDVELPLILNLAWERERVITLDEPVIIFAPGETMEFEGEVTRDREKNYWETGYDTEWFDETDDWDGYDYSVTLTNYGDFIAY